MSGSHMRVGGGGGCNPCGAQQAKGKGGGSSGSGQKAAAKEAGIPYGQYKKQFHDGFEGGNSQGSLLGGVGSVLSSLWGGWGGNSAYLNNFQGSTPQTVAEKNNSPVLDPVNLPPKDAAAKSLRGISQMEPDGIKDGKYTNAAMNCGPTVLAMIGEAYGKRPAGLTDAEYINQLGLKAGTTGEGTTGNGLISALNDMGMDTTATKGANLPWINSQLEAGRNVIADGDYYSLAAHPSDTQVAGHYIAVTAYTGGMYTITDPANGQTSQLTPQQLSDFIAHHPEGGFALSTWPEAAATVPVG